MAKQRRRRRNRNRSTASRFVEFAARRNMEDALNEMTNKQEQSKYQELVQKLEADILGRTVFVTNVLDLKQEENLTKLYVFMEREYGKVEKCERASDGGKRNRNHRIYPPARVRFEMKISAERIFQGRSLQNAKAEMVSCPEVGAKNGVIRIQPSKRYNGMTDDELKGESIGFDVQKLTMGQWCPEDLDTYVQFCPDSQCRSTNKDLGVFVEELTIDPGSDGALYMTINPTKRNVEIATRRGGSVLPGNSSSHFDSLTDFLLPSLALTNTKQLISFRFKELRSHMEASVEDNSLLFALKWPPKLYQSCCNIFDEEDRFYRDTHFLNAKGEDFGRCLAFQVHLSKTSMEKIANHAALAQLRKFGVLTKDFKLCDQPLSIRRRSIIDERPELQRKFDIEMRRVQSTCHPEIGFYLRALVDTGRCDWYHMLHDSVEHHESFGSKKDMKYMNLPQRLEYYYSSSSHENVVVVIQTLERMLGMQGCTIYPCQLFHLLIGEEDPTQNSDNERHSDDAIPLPDFCVRIPQLQLSPCGVRVIDIGTEIGNRAIRRFTKEEIMGPCSFVRLHVGDETGKHLFRDLSPTVQAHIRSKILNGIEVNGRKFKFLAYSSSQLKECSLWMVASSRSSIELRAALGNFSSCSTVSKWAARIGQCLTTTVDYKDHSSRNEILIVPDIKSKLGMEHSDGTGIISRCLFNVVCKKVPFAPDDPNDISILQIRFGGAKGTLSAWNVDDERLVQSELRRRGTKKIILRESMTKFDTTYDSIEVCAIGSTVPYYLNRFVTLLLKAHGIPDSTFLSMQREMIEKLDSMMYDPDTALKLLPSLSGPDSGLVNLLLHMLSSGQSPAKDPFLFSTLHAVRQHHLFTLRKKARIFVEKGAVLMGGLDESGVLKEGEVYVQTSQKDMVNPSKLIHKVVAGRVMVTKHPAMHMGDVRMLRAVDIPELRSHKNVILFSQHGDRPEADKMSGSDLDGDQFAVTWDERLFLPDGNHDPLDFTPPAANPIMMPQNVRSEHDAALVEHFVNHMKKIISKDGAGCERCVQLAKLHSIAVDFPKSGVPARLPDELKLPSNFKIGHWREVKKKETIRCTSIIGQLYDQVIGRDKERDMFQNHDAVVGRKIDSYGRVLSFFDSLHAEKKLKKIFCSNLPSMLGLSALTPDEKDRYIEQATEMMYDYELEVRALMNKYHIHSEGEIFTGCIRKYHKCNKKKQHSIAEEVRRSCRKLREDYREWFFQSVLYMVGPPTASKPKADSGTTEKLEGDDEDDYIMRIEEVSTFRKQKIVSAMDMWEKSARRTAFLLAGASYVVVYTPSQDNKSSRGGQKTALFSFPWLVADVIHAGISDALR